MRARYPSLSYSLPLLQFPARLSSFPVDLLWDWSFPRIFPTLFPCPPLSIFPMLPLSACFLSSSVEGSGGGRLPLPLRRFRFRCDGAPPAVSFVCLFHQGKEEEVRSRCLFVRSSALMVVWICLPACLSHPVYLCLAGSTSLTLCG